MSSATASTLLRPASDAPALTVNSKHTVASADKADEVCRVCSKKIVDRELQLSSQCVAASTRQSCRTPISTDNPFVCNICLDGCQDPVVTHCGHLFCWPCLFCWLDVSQQSGGLSQQQCPVCKASVQDKIIPLYDHGHGTRKADPGVTMQPDKEIPRRPLPAIVGTPAETTEYNHADRDADFSGSGDHRRSHANATTQGFIAEGMEPHSITDSARRAECLTPRRCWRFISENEVVLRWAFIWVASIATVCFAVA